MLPIPDLSNEDDLYLQGYHFVAGIDEAGRGPLAGPVVAGAVILPRQHLPWFELVRDSKQLSARKRGILFDLIKKESIAMGVGIISCEAIDAANILKATMMAMIQAVEKMPQRPQFLLIDGMNLPRYSLPQRNIIKGDGKCLSIACASIVAKVTRDRIMEEMDKIYPLYGFARHKGYGTKEHICLLNRLGPSPIHRRSFAPLKNALFIHNDGNSPGEK
jgi:ribonuclease HII